jgi:hypothetical protein
MANNLFLSSGIDLSLGANDTLVLGGNITGAAEGDGNEGRLNNFALTGNSSNWASGAGGSFSDSGTPTNSLNFDGTDDYVSVPAGSIFDFSNGLTVEGWFKAGNLNNHASLVSKFASGEREFSTLLLSTGVIEYSITFDGSSEQFFSGSTTLTAGTWYHMALTYDGTTMRAFINGAVDGTNSVSGTIYSGFSDLYMGVREEGSLTRYFNGNLDEVRIWNTVRSQAQIQASMNSELTGNETGLLVYYRFTQGTADGSNTGLDALIDNKIIAYDPNIINGNGLLIFDNNGDTSNFNMVKLNMNGVVQVNTGTTLQTNDSLSLIASSVSSYGQLVGGGTVLGTVSSQAYLDVSTARYHYLGSPFTNATLEEFNELPTAAKGRFGNGMRTTQPGKHHRP